MFSPMTTFYAAVLSIKALHLMGLLLCPVGMLYQFGVGYLLAKPRGGNASTPSGPVRFGTVQDIALDITQKLVKLMGQMKGPDDIAASDMEVKGKSGFGELDVNIWNALMFGDTVAAGITRAVIDEAAAIPTTPYQVTVVNAAHFIDDFGVRLASDGSYLKVVPSSPATGQYSVNPATGIYTFAAADTGNNVLISYTWSDTTHGRTATFKNHLQGYGPEFSLLCTMPYESNLSPLNDSGIELLRCKASKMSIPFKRDGYIISDFEFESFPDQTGTWWKFYESDTNQQE